MITENVKRKVSVVGSSKDAIKQLFLEELHEEVSVCKLCTTRGQHHIFKLCSAAVLLCQDSQTAPSLEAEHAQQRSVEIAVAANDLNAVDMQHMSDACQHLSLLQDILAEWGGPKHMEVRLLSMCASHASIHHIGQPCATRMRTCSLPV
jgi:hypothetical protein